MGGGGGDSAETTESDASEGGVTVHIRCSNGSKFSVQACLDSTVGSFKTVVAQHCDIPADQQRLIYKGRILKDDLTLDSYGLEADHTVHLVRGFAHSSSANPAVAADARAPNSLPADARSVGSDEGRAFGGSGLGPSLFPGLDFNGLGGGPGLFGAGLPEFEQVQQQLNQNPDLMRQIMNSPMVQSLMSNPDMIRNMIMNNPQMREIIDRNPELAHVLNDPSTLRQTLETASNPELMREMMRNTDRAMSNIEASPEGFNMLRRMYENVQEPLLNASTLAGDNRNDPGANPFAALLGTQGGEQLRHQSTGPTNPGSETSADPPLPNANPLPNPWASAGAGAAQTNPATRSNPGGNARAPAPGGLGLPELGNMFGSMPDSASLNQLLQNPAVSQMVQSLLTNPQLMNQLVDPQLRTVLDSSSQLREMMQDPEFIRQMTSPETMQQLMSLQQSLLSLIGHQPSTGEAGQPEPGVGTGTRDTAGLDMLMNMFGGLGLANTTTIPPRSNVPPEELYASQLTQLREMGFIDTQENIRALMATAGNVHAAVERLLANLGGQ